MRIVMKYILNTFVLFSALFLLNACGEGTVDIGAGNYSPKIVVEGYLVPGSNVENIIIGRNFPLNTSFSVNDVFIPNADVTLTAIETGKEYKLEYDKLKNSYRYYGNDLKIEYNRSYRLSVSATIDGQKLTAKSVTTTPLKGFSIDKTLSVKGDNQYREKDQNGEVQKLKLVFNPSPQTEFYAIGTVAIEASINKFIFENPYFNLDTNNVIDNLRSYQYESSWIQNVKSDVPLQEKNIEWMELWFYGKYRTIMYAGDQNFKDYFITINQLQEMDGNYHEPKLHFEGDGIGIFGSYIADTLYFTIKK